MDIVLSPESESVVRCAVVDIAVELCAGSLYAHIRRQLQLFVLPLVAGGQRGEPLAAVARAAHGVAVCGHMAAQVERQPLVAEQAVQVDVLDGVVAGLDGRAPRSEEQTSELTSQKSI